MRRINKELNIKDPSYQEKLLAKIESKVTLDHERDQAFHKLEYFGFTKLLNQSAVIEEKKVIEEKLRGNYMVKIRKDLPEPMRIAQLANEPISFHLHKRRDFLPRLEGKQPRQIVE